MIELLNMDNSSIIPGVTSSIVSMGSFGAVAGGAIAAVSNLNRVAKGEISGPEAITNTAKEAFETGLCTSSGTTDMRAGIRAMDGIIASFTAAGLVKTILIWWLTVNNLYQNR